MSLSHKNISIHPLIALGRNATPLDKVYRLYDIGDFEFIYIKQSIIWSYCKKQITVLGLIANEYHFHVFYGGIAKVDIVLELRPSLAHEAM